MRQSDQFALWQTQFESERMRLLKALGELTAGGVIERAQHIGATSVPELWAAPCIDIGLAVWPFPLEVRYRAILESLGYTPVTSDEDVTEHRFHHASGAFQLFVAEAGGDRWTDYLLLRDYLRATGSARQLFSEQKQAHESGSAAYASMKARLLPQLVEAAQAWWISRQSFEAVEMVAAELKEYTGVWALSSGWALDLYLGRVTRVHRDVDVIISRTDQLMLRQCLTDRDWKLLTPFEDKLEPWPPHMTLELPRHQVFAFRGEAFIDILLTHMPQQVWHYRRVPSIVQHLDRAVLQTARGIPFLAPELVLLFKSKNTSQRDRSRDQIDFENVCPHLQPERQAWLRWALLVTNPEHPWLKRLG